MTSPSRRKRPTTAPGRSTPVRTPISWQVALSSALALAGLTLAAPARAQGPPPPPAGPDQGRASPSAMLYNPAAPPLATPVSPPAPAPASPAPPRVEPIQPARFQFGPRGL